jgi:hypothetical protein
MSLHVLAYNLKQMINILGVRPLLKALTTRPPMPADACRGCTRKQQPSQTIRHRVFTRPRSNLALKRDRVKVCSGSQSGTWAKISFSHINPCHSSYLD